MESGMLVSTIGPSFMRPSGSKAVLGFPIGLERFKGERYLTRGEMTDLVLETIWFIPMKSARAIERLDIKLTTSSFSTLTEDQ